MCLMFNYIKEMMCNYSISRYADSFMRESDLLDVFSVQFTVQQVSVGEQLNDVYTINHLQLYVLQMVYCKVIHRDI